MNTLLATWLTTSVAFALLWLVSVRLRDVSIVDVFWGPAFVLPPGLGLLRGDTAPSPRQWVVLALVVAWGARLALHLYLRSRGQAEDHRYARMRAANGPGFVLRSLFTVFLLQASLVTVISLPLQAVFDSGAPRSLGVLDLMAALIVGIGLAVEAVADLQLTRFRRDPLQRRKVLDSGLWRYSRHPNYFGEALVWLGLGLFGATGSVGWPLFGSIAGPLVMLFLLLRVSGVSLLESTITERRPDYAAYIARTSAFVPRPPRRTHAA